MSQAKSAKGSPTMPPTKTKNSQEKQSVNKKLPPVNYTRLTRGGSTPKGTPEAPVTEKEEINKKKYKKSEDTEKHIEEHFKMNSSIDSETEEGEDQKSHNDGFTNDGYTEEDADFVRKMKKDIMEFSAETDIGKKTTPAAQRAFRAITYLQVIQHRCSKLPSGTSKEMDRAVDIISRNVMELEIKIQAATARLEAIEQYSQQTQHKEIEVVGKVPRKEEAAETRPPKGYAEAVKAATSTLIIEATEDRDVEDIEQQITRTTAGYHEGVKKIRRMKNGVKLICENENEALKIKETISKNQEASAAVKVRMGNIKKKKIMIFHIPETVSEEQITQKIKKTLGLGPQTSGEAVNLHRRVAARGDKVHQPVLLPEPLADHLLRARTICLGLRECPIKEFISVTRCHKCLEYDHVAAQCRNGQRCTNCAGDHASTDCTKQRPRCFACTRYNEINKSWLRTQKDTEHPANSSACWYRNHLLRVRQLQSERGMAPASALEVLRGRVSINYYLNGKDKLIFTSNRELKSRTQQETLRRRYHGNGH